MIGSEIKAIVGESNENGDMHIHTELDNDLTPEEMLAAVGSIVTDCVTLSNGKLDVENFVNIIRAMHYNGL